MGPGYSSTSKLIPSDVLSLSRLQLLRVTMESSWCHSKAIGKNIYIGLGQRSRLWQESDFGLG